MTPYVPIVLSLLLLLWVSLVVITIFSYVGVFGKGFPVASSLYVYLISFLVRVSYSGLDSLFDVNQQNVKTTPGPPGPP